MSNFVGWKGLLDGWPSFGRPRRYPIAAYSEFMPPPRVGRKPYGTFDPMPFDDRDPFGWPVPEHQESQELGPGLASVARELLRCFDHLGSGRPTHGITKAELAGNPYWPEILASALPLAHERYVTLLPLALSRTQDDKGRVRWTLFGASEQGPAKAFWQGFREAPGREWPAERILRFFRNLLHAVYGEQEPDLRKVGFRVLPEIQAPDFPYWGDAPLPDLVRPLMLTPDEPVESLRYLLTFRPFGTLPEPVQRAYVTGRLHLLPFPGSLVFWGAGPYRRLANALPRGMQIPLLRLIPRHEQWHGMRVPQSGWLHEARPGGPEPTEIHGAMRNTFKRTHRWTRVLRHEDELALTTREEHMTHVLFSTHPDDIGLYGKPMARNVQLWSDSFDLLLDGPNASRADIEQALRTVQRGGMFGYRFYFPPMRCGNYEVFWHRPLAAYCDPGSREAVVLSDGPLGYLTAYAAEGAAAEGTCDHSKSIELWPRLLRREAEHLALSLYGPNKDTRAPARNQATGASRTANHADLLNIEKLLAAKRLLGDQPLRPSFARALLTAPRDQSLHEWLATLTASTEVRGGSAARSLLSFLHATIATEAAAPAPALTYDRTARRRFEVSYWKTIAYLAESRYLTKNNADCVDDTVTRKALRHHERDLDALGDFILGYYRSTIAKAAMTGGAFAGELPFLWQTDLDYSWMGGWRGNQEGAGHERNLMVVIPGRNRGEAIVMADHYDTAYMEDHYERARHGDGARLAAAGADDNHSATAALMLAAPIFLDLSRRGQLARDIWLIHLTGEEFPADCLGARHLCQHLVEGSLELHLPNGHRRDLSGSRVRGVYVLDMIAHNNDRHRDIFQIAPGNDAESFWLANHAHLANMVWNAGTQRWNRHASRRRLPRGHRSPDGKSMPRVAPYLALHGEVRPSFDPRSTLFNTDGQIFSDAGVPVVLFMEDYDINRTGYHDSLDTMANINLDYGAALASIAIESVARAASED